MKELIKEYLSNEAFKSNFDRMIYPETPYIRPCRPQDLEFIFDSYLNLNHRELDINSNTGLFINRVLLNIYEQSSIFIPNTNKFSLDKFINFYNKDNIDVGNKVKGFVEERVFGFLENEINIGNTNWTIKNFTEYTKKILDQIKMSESKVHETIKNHNNPKDSIKFYFIQFASDFLSEASAMSKNIAGNFGKEISELFKILIDEYGYGVHDKKHSTIYEKLLEDCDLDSSIHYYWQFYLPSSLMLTNYFYYISTNHRYFFRYLGALYFSEASLQFITKKQSELTKEVFGNEFNTLYFDEHTHIDKYHGSMALEKLIKPLVEKLGENILEEIMYGFIEFKYISELADEELLKHLEFYNNIESYIEKAKNIEEFSDDSYVYFREEIGQVSISHMHDSHELFEVVKGKKEVYFTPFLKVVLNDGDKIIIPKGILHGSIVMSDNCEYRRLSLDYIN